LLESAAGFPDVEIQALGRPELELEQPGSATRVIFAVRPDVVVNAAAYTAVDLAEEEPERAFQVNGEAAGEVASAAREIGAAVIQVSTDYVFDGSSTRAWRPDDQTSPLNVYGASKVMGEQQVRARNPRHLILRTSWVFSPFGRNFIRTMLRLAADRDEVRVVGDQRGCPTSALDLAEAILQVASRWDPGDDTAQGSTMHVAGAESCSWAEFAQAIFEASASAEGPVARVVPITAAEFPTLARRPAFSVLDCSAFEQAFAWPMPRWRDALPSVVGRILRDPA
jgi:dTDP-4-dehydrorhamnose reductase